MSIGHGEYLFSLHGNLSQCGVSQNCFAFPLKGKDRKTRQCSGSCRPPTFRFHFTYQRSNSFSPRTQGRGTAYQQFGIFASVGYRAVSLRRSSYFQTLLRVLVLTLTLAFQKQSQGHDLRQWSASNRHELSFHKLQRLSPQMNM